MHLSGQCFAEWSVQKKKQTDIYDRYDTKAAMLQQKMQNCTREMTKI